MAFDAAVVGNNTVQVNPCVTLPSVCLVNIKMFLGATSQIPAIAGRPSTGGPDCRGGCRLAPRHVDLLVCRSTAVALALP